MELKQARCPICGVWGDLDEDQYHGRVSMICGNGDCHYHETHDLSAPGEPTT